MNTSTRIYLQEMQGQLFALANQNNYDILEFIHTFMNSNLAKELDKEYSPYQQWSAIQWLEEITSKYPKLTKKKNEYSIDAIEWLGYFYRTWHFITGEPSFKIVRYMPALKGLENHYSFHQYEYGTAIELAKNQYNRKRNSHRKYEVNKSKANQEIKDKSNSKDNLYSKPIYYQYLARRMLFKLLNDESIKNATHKIDDDKYDFISPNHKYGIKGDVIFSSDSRTIDQKFDNVNNQYSTEVKNSIYFCFIFSKQYEILSEEDFIEVVKKFRDKYLHRNYDYIYFYILGALIEISASNEIHKFYLPLSIKERAGIKKEIELDNLYDELDESITKVTNSFNE